MRVQGLCWSWGRRRGERARSVRTPPRLAPWPPGRVGGAGLQRCQRSLPRANAVSHTSDGLVHLVGSTVTVVFEMNAGEHWMRQPLVRLREDLGRCNGV